MTNNNAPNFADDLEISRIIADIFPIDLTRFSDLFNFLTIPEYRITHYGGRRASSNRRETVQTETRTDSHYSPLEVDAAC